MAFAGLILLGMAIVLYETRGLSYYFDDWDFVLHRRGMSPSVLLRPHGPHLSLVPILIYKLLLKVFGGSSYLPFRLLAAVDLAAIALALGLVCRRAWGRWWGLVPVFLVVTLGTGAWTLLWSFQVGYAIATAAGLLALVALGREGRRADGLACGLLVLSLASGSQGVCFLAGAAVSVVLRGRWRRSAWVVVIPAALYGLWYLKYGHQASETQLSQWRGSLSYAMTSFSSTISGLFGLGAPSSDLPPRLDPSFGQPVALAALAGLAIALCRGWRPPRIFWAAAATLVALWVAASLSNLGGTRQPTDSRYLPPDAVLLLVCVCTAFRRPLLRRAGTIALLVILAVVAATNAGQFTPVRNMMLGTSIASRAQLGTLLIMRGVVPSWFTPAPAFTTGLVNDVQAGPFYSAYDAFGLPADSVAALLRADEGTREIADQALDRGEELGFEFTTAGQLPAARPPTVLSGQARVRGSCIAPAGAGMVLRATPGIYEFVSDRTGSLTASARRFASRFDIPFGSLSHGRTAVVRIPADSAPAVPWRIAISGQGRVCA